MPTRFQHLDKEFRLVGVKVWPIIIILYFKVGCGCEPGVGLGSVGCWLGSAITHGPTNWGWHSRFWKLARGARYSPMPPRA